MLKGTGVGEDEDEDASPCVELPFPRLLPGCSHALVLSASSTGRRQEGDCQTIACTRPQERLPSPSSPSPPSTRPTRCEKHCRTASLAFVNILSQPRQAILPLHAPAELPSSSSKEKLSQGPDHEEEEQKSALVLRQCVVPAKPAAKQQRSEPPQIM